jgi:hypothetical protein
LPSGLLPEDASEAQVVEEAAAALLERAQEVSEHLPSGLLPEDASEAQVVEAEATAAQLVAAAAAAEVAAALKEEEAANAGNPADAEEAAAAATTAAAAYDIAQDEALRAWTSALNAHVGAINTNPFALPGSVPDPVSLSDGAAVQETLNTFPSLDLSALNTSKNALESLLGGHFAEGTQARTTHAIDVNAASSALTSADALQTGFNVNKSGAEEAWNTYMQDLGTAWQARVEAAGLTYSDAVTQAEVDAAEAAQAAAEDVGDVELEGGVEDGDGSSTVDSSYDTNYEESEVFDMTPSMSVDIEFLKVVKNGNTFTLLLKSASLGVTGLEQGSNILSNTLITKFGSGNSGLKNIADDDNYLSINSTKVDNNSSMINSAKSINQDVNTDWNNMRLVTWYKAGEEIPYGGSEVLKFTANNASTLKGTLHDYYANNGLNKNRAHSGSDYEGVFREFKIEFKGDGKLCLSSSKNSFIPPIKKWYVRPSSELTETPNKAPFVQNRYAKLEQKSNPDTLVMEQEFIDIDLKEGVFDYDNDLESLVYSLGVVTETDHATIAFVTGEVGVVRYTPKRDAYSILEATQQQWEGTDSFTYTVTDGISNPSSATVTVDVDFSEFTPVAMNVEMHISEQNNDNGGRQWLRMD